MTTAAHSCLKADRKCRDCVACDVHRRTHRVSPAGKLPFGVERCSHCDGDSAHLHVRAAGGAA